MLILTRKPGQLLTIEPHKTLDLLTPVYELFAYGPIEVTVLRIRGSQVRLGIQADPRLQVLREELAG